MGAEAPERVTVHPRLFAQVWILRATLAWEISDMKRYRICVNYALAWYMRCAQEGWSRIVEDCALSPSTARKFKQLEHLKVPMEEHTVQALRKRM